MWLSEDTADSNLGSRMLSVTDRHSIWLVRVERTLLSAAFDFARAFDFDFDFEFVLCFRTGPEQPQGQRRRTGVSAPHDQLPRVPRPCRVFCDRAGILTSYPHHRGHSCPRFFITNKLCEPSQTSSIAQCDNDPLMGKGRGVLVN